MEMVSRVLGDVHATGQHRHLDGGGEIGGPEDDGLEPGRSGADLLHVYEAACGLDLCLDADVADREPARLLHLGQKQVEGDDLGCRLDLGEHHLVESFTGVPTTSMTSPKVHSVSHTFMRTHSTRSSQAGS